MAKTLDAAHSEIQNRLQRWDKMDTTLLFGINFGPIRTCWKEDFVHLALDQLFGAIPNLDREENP